MSYRRSRRIAADYCPIRKMPQFLPSRSALLRQEPVRGTGPSAVELFAFEEFFDGANLELGDLGGGGGVALRLALSRIFGRYLGRVTGLAKLLRDH